MLEYGLDYYSDSEYEPGIRYSRSIKKTMKQRNQLKKSTMILKNIHKVFEDEEEDSKVKDDDNNEQSLETTPMVI